MLLRREFSYDNISRFWNNFSRTAFRFLERANSPCVEKISVMHSAKDKNLNALFSLNTNFVMVHVSLESLNKYMRTPFYNSYKNINISFTLKILVREKDTENTDILYHFSQYLWICFTFITIFGDGLLLSSLLLNKSHKTFQY